MATVPEYRRQIENRPVNRQGVRVNTSADTFGAGIGRATQKVSDGVFDVAKAVDFKQQLTSDADARDAFDAYRYDQREAMRAPETGYLNRTGANGVDVQKPAEQQLRELRESHGEGLNPRARKKYDKLVDGMQDQAHSQLLTHSSNETRNYIKNKRSSTIAGYAEEAATNWNDQELFDKNLGLALQEQNELANLQGWDDATRKQAAEKLVSNTVKQRVVMTAAEDPIAAQEMLENSREALNAEDEYDLDTNLKGMVIDAKADQFTQQFVKNGGGPAGGSDPYATLVVGAESGGDPYAANNPQNPGYASPDGTRSSALGPHQFLRGTYLETVEKMRSEGGAAWAQGMSSVEIAATRTDTDIEGSVYQYYRRQNQAAIEAAGFNINPTTEYAFHHFGAGGGADLLRAAKYNPAVSIKKVFGDDVLRANPQFKGKTAGEALDWVEGHLGADKPGAYFDASGAFQAAMQIEDPELRDAALKKINSLRVMQDNAKSSSRKQAQEQAWNQYAETGKTDLGFEMKQAMGQSGWTAFQNAVANDRRGIDITAPETWDTLTEASANPQEFVDINLEAHRANLSKADYRQFKEQQVAMEKQLDAAPFEQAKEKAALPYAKLIGYTDDIYEGRVDDTSDVDMTQEQRNQRMQFQRQMQQLIGEFYDREQREPSQVEVQNMAMGLTLPVTTTSQESFLWRSGDVTREGSMFQMANRPDDATFEVAYKYEDVPYADKSRIAAQLTAEGVEVTQQEIADTYEREVMMRAGLPPRVDISDVPDDIADAVRENNPGASDTAVVEAYQAFLMDQFRSSKQ